MSGYLLLEGGAEFGGQMAVPDREALTLAGDPASPVAVIPAAAAPDHNDARAGRNAVRWFESLGATQVEALPLVDRTSADDPAIAARLRRARLIYLLGGFPAHLAASLRGSLGWQAILAAHRAGAVIAGSSAGAMVLCGHYYDPVAGEVKAGLGLLDGICVIPHHETFSAQWVPAFKEALPTSLLMGIDEETGALGQDVDGPWRVLGKGQVTLYGRGKSVSWGHGEDFHIRVDA